MKLYGRVYECDTFSWGEQMEMEVEIKQQFEIGFWFFNFCWYILNTYFNILFTYFIFWFLKQTAILFYFTNTNFVFCVHLSPLSPSLSLSLFLLHMYVRWFRNFRLILIFLRISVTFLPSRCLLKFLLPQFTVCVENICLSAFLSVYLCVSVCMYIHIYIYILTRISIYIHTYVTYSISIWIWIYIACSVTLASLIGQRP